MGKHTSKHDCIWWLMLHTDLPNNSEQCPVAPFYSWLWFLPKFQIVAGAQCLVGKYWTVSPFFFHFSLRQELQSFCCSWSESKHWKYYQNAIWCWREPTYHIISLKFTLTQVTFDVDPGDLWPMWLDHGNITLIKNDLESRYLTQWLWPLTHSLDLQAPPRGHPIASTSTYSGQI